MAKYHLITYGCQMNKNDSERISGMLLDLGFEATDEAKDSDLIIINTCSVRQASEDRVYGVMRNFVKLKEKNPGLIVVLTGCMAGRDKDGKIQARLPGVDIFLPTERMVELPKMLVEKIPLYPPSERGEVSNFFAEGARESSPFEKGSTRLSASGGTRVPPKADAAGEGFFDLVPRQSSKSSAFVTIQTGCEEYCTYCVVPYARGKIKNRSLAEILSEIKSAVAGGAVEITLLGQIVNAWEASVADDFLPNNPFVILNEVKDLSRMRAPTSGEILRSAQNDSKGFAALLWEVNRIPGIKRLSFFSAHPRYMTDEVIEAMKLPAHLNYLHLPVQSGSDKILQKMNRRYTAAEYLEVIKKVRSAKPDVALATDIIVGFPGETVEDFEQTVELYKKCDFDIAFLAKYSPRSGTPAFRALKDDVSREEKERRWQILQKLMEETVFKKNQKYLGQMVEVLVEDCKNDKCWGWSRENKRVIFPGNQSLIGQLVNVKVEKAKEWELEGEIIDR